MNDSAKGFTFVELMVVLTVGAVLISLALPNFASMVRNNRIKSLSDSLLNSLSLARSEAIKRSVTVTVCKSKDGASCIASGDFSQGWIVFVDDGVTVGTVDVGEDIVHVRSDVHDTLSLAGAGVGATNIANFLAYGARGTTTDVGSLTLCDDRDGAHGKRVTVSAMGRNKISGGVNCSS